MFERDKWTCEDCGATNKTLHAHHVSYEKGLDTWDYQIHEIMCLCEECHERKHSLITSLQKVASYLPNKSIDTMGWISLYYSSLVDSGNSEEANGIMNGVKLKLEQLYKAKKQKS